MLGTGWLPTPALTCSTLGWVGTLPASSPTRFLWHGVGRGEQGTGGPWHAASLRCFLEHRPPGCTGHEAFGLLFPSWLIPTPGNP